MVSDRDFRKISSKNPQNEACGEKSVGHTVKQPSEYHGGKSQSLSNGCKSTAAAVSDADEKQSRGKNGGITGKAQKGSLPLSKASSQLYHGSVDTDPQGSYTGRPENLGEVPVQDADDL